MNTQPGTPVSEIPDEVMRELDFSIAQVSPKLCRICGASREISRFIPAPVSLCDDCFEANAD